MKLNNVNDIAINDIKFINKKLKHTKEKFAGQIVASK